MKQISALVALFALAAPALARGPSYLFQLGAFSGSPGGTGTSSNSNAVPCGTTNGPDVIVGDINGVQNYTAAAGVDAISLGTTSCNLGNVWVEWIANNNHHPAIGGTLYHYHVVSGAGRFEQIGLSWLKHGFYALSETLCCPTCIATDGTHLGVGCSDPYTGGPQRNAERPRPALSSRCAYGLLRLPAREPELLGPDGAPLRVPVERSRHVAGQSLFRRVPVRLPRRRRGRQQQQQRQLARAERQRQQSQLRFLAHRSYDARAGRDPGLGSL